ncbi:tripartite tricarboxylate transporter TctB family protein [Parasedimentitalea huanghaiensis]|uniref:Tripartite tricarboxylate transporter TctB family protein n=1 Tax=Parasedimentitalea huanghaiensis TaxID=2682100 RepID=A0A6L6WR17_9RHOB|nr:tripartite tricarboxylate transporter TctB family protein [Zongyanglinia huanghaiensis]MVO18002.1 tripartite tricarboxylate transporter TctB family protein [Zongyanglinia huanghaiensis]
MRSDSTTLFVRLFHRERRPGDLVFAVAFMIVAASLLAMMPWQTIWAKRTDLYTQPRFWPAVSLGGMLFFAILHSVSSFVSPRIAGRWSEVWLWIRSLEYAGWFLVYVSLVPLLGYLLSTVFAAAALMLRAGYRDLRTIGTVALVAFGIVVLFKSVLQVNLPGGALYEFLPSTLRSFMLTYF